MNAHIELTIIEVEGIIKLANAVSDTYKARGCYAVTLPAHMVSAMYDVKEHIESACNGTRREVLMLDARYIDKRIGAILNSAVKGTHVTDTGLMHLITACEELIDNLREIGQQII